MKKKTIIIIIVFTILLLAIFWWTFGYSDFGDFTNDLAFGFVLIFPFLQTFVTVGLIGRQKFSSKPTSKRFRVVLWISIIITLLLWLLIFILNILLKDYGSAFLG